jgi:hypothetical protein
MAGQLRGCPPATTHLLCASGIRGQRQDGRSLYNGGSPGVCSTPSTWSRTSGGGARGRPQTYPSPDRRYGAARGVDRSCFAHRCMQTKWNNHAYRGAGPRPRLQDKHTKLLLSGIMYAPLPCIENLCCCRPNRCAQSTRLPLLSGAGANVARQMQGIILWPSIQQHRIEADSAPTDAFGYCPQPDPVGDDHAPPHHLRSRR